MSDPTPTERDRELARGVNDPHGPTERVAKAIAQARAEGWHDGYGAGLDHDHKGGLWDYCKPCKAKGAAEEREAILERARNMSSPRDAQKFVEWIEARGREGA